MTRDLDGAELDRAVAAAWEADVVVLALGGASLWFAGERTEGEGSDSADIALPAAQVRLAEAVVATGIPTVVVLVQGRAYTLPEVVRDAPALLISDYGGPFGLQAVADVLFGTTNPSGKLPYSMPRHGGQVPRLPPPEGWLGLSDATSARAWTSTTWTCPPPPLYPFGHGLSYTTFALSDLAVTPTIDMQGAASVSATVSNTGDRAGATVVQLYLRVNTSGVTRPAQQLAGFPRRPRAGHSRR